MMIYKHTACIPRWKDVKRFASTSFQGWIDMLCLYKHCLTLKKETLTLMSTLICWYNVIIVLQTNWSISIHKFIIILLHFERVYIRPEMKSTRTEISTHHKRNFAYITFHCGRNQIKICFEGGPKNDLFSKSQEINACADVSFHMIPFLEVFTWYFIARNEINFCQYDRNEITPAVSLISGCII